MIMLINLYDVALSLSLERRETHKIITESLSISISANTFNFFLREENYYVFSHNLR